MKFPIKLEIPTNSVLAKSFYIFVAAFLLLLLSLLSLLIPSREVAPAFVPIQILSPARGSWDGNIFTNQYLRLKLEIPDSPWRSLSDTEISQLPGGHHVTDFYLYHEETSSSIELTFKRMPQGLSEYSLQEHLRHCGESEMNQAIRRGFNSSFQITGMTVLADIEWLTKRSEFYMPGVETVLTFHLTSQDGDYIRCIKFVVGDDYEFLDILTWFDAF